MKRRGVLEDPSVRLVRVDVIEAWARHLYVMQNLPGYTTSMRRAILCECDDGRAAYVRVLASGLAAVADHGVDRAGRGARPPEAGS